MKIIKILSSEITLDLLFRGALFLESFGLKNMHQNTDPNLDFLTVMFSSEGVFLYSMLKKFWKFLNFCQLSMCWVVRSPESILYVSLKLLLLDLIVQKCWIKSISLRSEYLKRKKSWLVSTGIENMTKF